MENSGNNNDDVLKITVETVSTNRITPTVSAIVYGAFLGLGLAAMSTPITNITAYLAAALSIMGAVLWYHFSAMADILVWQRNKGYEAKAIIKALIKGTKYDLDGQRNGDETLH